MRIVGQQVETADGQIGTVVDQENEEGEIARVNVRIGDWAQWYEIDEVEAA